MLANFTAKKEVDILIMKTNHTGMFKFIFGRYQSIKGLLSSKQGTYQMIRRSISSTDVINKPPLARVNNNEHVVKVGSRQKSGISHFSDKTVDEIT